MPTKNNHQRESKSLAQLADEIGDSEIYDIEVARFRISEAIDSLMKAQGLNKADLAARLGTSRAYITKLLQGNGNFTLETLVKISRALNARYLPTIVSTSVEGKIVVSLAAAQIDARSLQLTGSVEIGKTTRSSRESHVQRVGKTKPKTTPVRSRVKT